jgi:two-component system capsular synthesis sensor histidine kinase RcsC
VTPLGLRVLAAEDETINRVVLARQLTVLGCSHQILASGEEVLAQLDATKHDVVVLDVCMPGLGGDEVARRIRALRRAEARIPIILVTANEGGASPQPDDDAYLRLLKPLSIPELRSALAACVRMQANR